MLSSFLHWDDTYDTLVDLSFFLIFLQHSFGPGCSLSMTAALLLSFSWALAVQLSIRKHTCVTNVERMVKVHLKMEQYHFTETPLPQ